ncbi:MAG: stage II sporulation protein M [Actinobacteria bacterium]|nr:stage II sporulation protein M [Actinomycetota bacterium]
MTLDAFLTAREPDWQRLADALRRARGRPERLGPVGALELGALYRSAAADLALARRRFPGEPVLDRLEALVRDGRQAVYGRRTRRPALRAFVATGYWREVRRRPGALALAWTALLAPALLAGGWALADPGAAVGLVPPAFRAAAGPTVAHAHDLAPATQASLASEIFTNNIRVSFVAFAGGLTLGIATLLVVASNGVLLGVLAGLTLDNGNFQTFVRYVAPHGLLELSCIAVSACAGLRIAWAIIDPGPVTRLESLRVGAREAVVLVLGTAAWLVVAGLTEGFLTPRGVGLATALAVGFGLAGLYWALVLWRGRPGPAERRPGRAAARAPRPPEAAPR